MKCFYYFVHLTNHFNLMKQYQMPWPKNIVLIIKD